MIRCPKCGSDRITGPRYISHAFTRGLGEALRYTCAVCGYIKDTATKDKRC